MKQYFIISVMICFAVHGMEKQDRAPKGHESKSLSVADLNKIFDESKKRDHARKLLENVCHSESPLQIILNYLISALKGCLIREVFLTPIIDC